MSMTVLQLGDIHLGDVPSDEEDRCLNAVVALARQRGPIDLVVLGGDFQAGRRQRSSPEMRQRLRHLAQSLAGPDAPSPRGVVVRGNHDLLGDLQHLGDIPGWTYHEEADVFEVLAQDGSMWLQVSVIPYPESYWLLDAEGAEGAEVGTVSAMEDALRKLLFAHLDRDPVASELPTLPFAAVHLSIAEASVRLGQPLIAKEPMISARDFEGFVGVAAQHIHFGQQHAVPGGGLFVYGGSLWPTSFGEEGQTGKGPVLWTITPDGECSVERLPLDAYYHRLCTVELEWCDQIQQLTWKLDGAPYNGPTDLSPVASTTRTIIADAKVRVLVRYPSTARGAIDIPHIERQFRDAGAFHAKCVAESTQLGTITVPELAEEAAAAMSLAEELDLMWHRTGSGPSSEDEMAWTDTALQKLQTA